jgi:hypothetical protein
VQSALQECHNPVPNKSEFQTSKKILWQLKVDMKDCLETNDLEKVYSDKSYQKLKRFFLKIKPSTEPNISPAEDIGVNNETS